MKKMFVMLTAVIITASAWATPSPVVIENEKAKAAFSKEFTEAKEVSWTQKEGYYLVSFKLNNDWMLAWYTGDGEMQAVQRSIQTSQMTYLAAKAVDHAKCVSVYKVFTSGDYSRISKTKKKKE